MPFALSLDRHLNPKLSVRVLDQGDDWDSLEGSGFWVAPINSIVRIPNQ